MVSVGRFSFIYQDGGPSGVFFQQLLSLSFSGQYWTLLGWGWEGNVCWCPMTCPVLAAEPGSAVAKKEKVLCHAQRISQS